MAYQSLKVYNQKLNSVGEVAITDDLAYTFQDLLIYYMILSMKHLKKDKINRFW